jgi:thiopeptide-type bacteriocin biosynthesis protein
VGQDSDHRWSAHHFFYHGDLDLALIYFVRPAIAELIARQLIDSFFFIRYTLGGPHIRIRYHLTPTAVPGAIAHVLQEAAARFLERWWSESALDPERIRQESRAILAAAPEASELWYADHSLLPSAFEPEVERYGGRALLDPSLDFFAISSAQALEAIRDPNWSSPGRRGAIALRLLLRQAWGFAVSEKELLAHLGYRLPVDQETGNRIWSKADTDFETRRDNYRALLKHELSLLAEAGGTPEPPVWPSAAFLPRAARLLSQSLGEVAPETRWQIGHSQLHMTANRLGFFPPQEMHLQRILWRAARDLAETEPGFWRQVLSAPPDREPAPRSSLRELLAPVTGHLAATARTSTDWLQEKS